MSQRDRTRTGAARTRTIERKCARHLKRGNARITLKGNARANVGEW